MQVPPGFSEYPRPPMYQSGIRSRPPGIYFDVLGDAWTLFQQQWQAWVGAGFLFFLIYVVLLIPATILTDILQYGSPLPQPGVTPSLAASLSTVPVNLLFGMFMSVLQTGYLLMGLKQVRGEQIKATDIFGALPFFLPLFGAMILMYLAMFVGCCAAIIGIFCLTGAFAFYPFIIADQRVGPVEAFQRSWKAVGGFWSGLGVFALLFVLGIVASLGFLGCGFGILVTMPLYAIGLALHYTFYFPEMTPQSAMA